MKLKLGGVSKLTILIFLVTLFSSQGLAETKIKAKTTLRDEYMHIVVNVYVKNPYLRETHLLGYVATGGIFKKKVGLVIRSIDCEGCEVKDVVARPEITIMKIALKSRNFTLDIIADSYKIDRKFYKTFYLPIFESGDSNYTLILSVKGKPYYFNPRPKIEDNLYVWENPSFVMIEFSPISLPFRVVYLPLIVILVIVGVKLAYPRLPRKSGAIQYVTLNNYSFTANEGVIAMATVENTGTTKFDAKVIIELFDPNGNHMFTKVFEKRLRKGETFNVSHRFTIMPTWPKGVYKLKITLLENEKVYDERIQEFSVR